jgi:hypothetical protein
MARGDCRWCSRKRTHAACALCGRIDKRLRERCTPLNNSTHLPKRDSSTSLTFRTARTNLADRTSGLGPFPAPDQRKPPRPPMDGNDKYGDCTMAGVAHLIEAWNTLYKKSLPVPSDKQVVAEFLKLNGGQTDVGLSEAGVLGLWHTSGLFGEQIGVGDHLPAARRSQAGQPGDRSRGPPGRPEEGVMSHDDDVISHADPMNTAFRRERQSAFGGPRRAVA